MEHYYLSGGNACGPGRTLYKLCLLLQSTSSIIELWVQRVLVDLMLPSKAERFSLEATFLGPSVQ